MRLVLDFFAALDERRHADAAELFADDGVWERQGTELSGRDAIRAALDARPAGRATAHVVTNLRVDTEDGVRATARFLLVAYEHAAGQSSGPLAPSAIRACTDTLAYDGERWRIADKRSRRQLPPE